MPVNYEQPQYHHDDSHVSRDYRVTHPAYAQISASSVTGGTYLYGSDFKHQNYVVIRIKKSELVRGLSTDWPFAREEVVEVALSESQWATFVSAMNRGEGVQCTLQSVGGKSIPQIPESARAHEKFKLEASEASDEALRAIESLQAKIADSKLSQKTKDEVSKSLSFIRDRTQSNMKFIMEQFGEHMEKTVQKARTEISAYAQNTIMRTGIAALPNAEDARRILGYEDSKDDRDQEQS